MSAGHKHRTYDGEVMPIASFFEFIYDRHLIWHKRFVLKQPRPWTQDITLNRYLFNNVFRELDKGSKHLIEHVLSDKTYSVEERLYNALFYRRFNVYGFFKEILPKPLNLQDWDSWDLIGMFDAHREAKKSIYNVAYNICQVPIDKNFRPLDKHVQLILAVKDVVHKRLFKNFRGSAESCYNLLKQAHGIGNFLGFQLLLDASYMEDANIIGLDRFVICGPGAINGLNMIGCDIRKADKALRRGMRSDRAGKNRQRKSP